MKKNKRIELTDRFADIHADPQFVEGEPGLVATITVSREKSPDKNDSQYLNITYNQRPGNDCYDSGIFDI